MKTIPFCYLFFILCIVSCKNNLNKNVNVKGYEGFILLAENSIINKDYIKANDFYLKAFKLNSYIFGIDAENALLTCIEKKNWKDASFWSEKLFLKGVRLNFFESSKYYEFKKTSEWKTLFKSFKNLNNKFLKNTNSKLIDSLSLLTELDQFQYCQIPTGKTNFKESSNKTVILDFLFNNLIKNKGFPTEEKVGLNIVNDTFISPLPKYYALLRHSYQSNLQTTDSTFKVAIKDLKFKKDVYYNISSSDEMTYVVINCKIYENKYFTNEDLRRKIVFDNKENYIGFKFFTNLALLPDTKIEDFDLNGNKENIYTYVTEYKKCKNK